MAKVKIFLALFAFLFANNLIHAQLYGHLTFTNPQIIGNKFRISLNVASVGLPWYIGSSNFRIDYTATALANPIIYAEAFPSPDFGTSTTAGTSSSIMTVNTGLVIPYYSGSNNTNSVIIPNTGADLAIIEWDIVNQNVPITLKWRISSNTTANPKTAIVDNGTHSGTASLVSVSQKSFTLPNLTKLTASPDITLDCNTPSTTLTASGGGGNNYLWSTGETTASITVSPIMTTTYHVTATNGSTEEVIVTKNLCTAIASRVYLPQINKVTLLMTPYISSLSNFPMSDPYATAPLNTKFVHVNSGPVATTTPLVLSATGNNAIIDWVFLELRTGTSGSTTVAYSKAALLQADGDIVDMDGISPAKFINAPVGDYYFTVRHRNHLGFRTGNKITISSASAPINLSNGSVAIYGNTSMTPLTANLNTMVGGDADSDGSVDAFDTIIWEQQNGLFDDYGLVSDYDLDGSADAFDSIIWELNNGKFQELD